MKKKNFFMATAVAAVCAGSVATVNAFDSNEREFTALELANIEALTENEGGFEYPTGMPYRITCGVETGKNFWGTKHCKVEIITCQGGGSGCNTSPCPVHPRQ